MFSAFEMIFLAILAFIVIGPQQIPEVARKLGRLINELKRASSSFTSELQNQNPMGPNSPPQVSKTNLKSVDKAHGNENEFKS